MALPTIRALLASAAAVHLQVRERPELQLMLFLVVDRTRVDDEADGVEPAEVLHVEMSWSRYGTPGAPVFVYRGPFG